MVVGKQHVNSMKKPNGKPISLLHLLPGMRVELTGTPTAVTLRGHTGKIVREDEDDEYVIVELDVPAQYRHANGDVEELPEIVVMTDNLRVLGR